MFHSRRLLFLLLFTCSFAGQAHAQQTILSEVDTTFLDTLIVYARRNYPRTKVFQERINISKENLTKQKLGWFESLTFSYVQQPDNGVALNATTPVFLRGYQFGLFINVGGILERPAAIRQAGAELRSSKFEAAEYDLTLRTEVKGRYYIYLQQNATLRVISKSVIDGQSVLESARLRYEKSEVTFEEYSRVIIANNANIQTKLAAEANLLTAISSLEELIGVNFLELKKKYGAQ